MSIITKTKEFFGLAPLEDVPEDEYFDDERYEERGRAPERERGSFEDERRRPERREPRSFEPDYAAPSRVRAVAVTSYAEATRVGEPVRRGEVVVFDLSGMPHDEAKRIIDFAAGVCFALHAGMQKMRPRVFRIVPADAIVDDEAVERALRSL